jgi:AcrR family transcriptional regulator
MNRKEEIVKSCKELYKTKKFEEINIKNIAEQTTFSRPSIYNYFQTKEEIFLEIIKEEYELWGNDLDNLSKEKKMSKEEYADKFSKILCKRTNLLKIQAMNMFDIEGSSRVELLTEFKVVVKDTFSKMNQSLNIVDIKDKDKFIELLMPFIHGIYPFANVTDKQKKAMKDAGMEFKQIKMYDLVYDEIISLLG